MEQNKIKIPRVYPSFSSIHSLLSAGKSSDEPNFTSYLPEDVFTNILLKLSIKSLLTCTCVCKTWNSFIKSPEFVSSHLDRTVSANRNTGNHICLFQLCSLPLKTGRDNFFLRDNDIEFSLHKRLHFPFKSKYGGFQVVASCNGLVCLMEGKHNLHTCGVGLILWNPVIRKSMIVENHPRLNPLEVVGLGFDSRTGDYKLLTISEELGKQTSMVNLYSLNANAWKRLPNVAAMLLRDVSVFRAMTFLNGALHFIAMRGRSKNPRLIIWGFDMSEEVFHEIMLPHCMVDEFFRHPSYISRQFHLSTCGESLAVSWIRDSIGVMEIWVMKEYAVDGSWVHVLTISLEGFPHPMEFEITGLVFREDAHVLVNVAYSVNNVGRIFSHDLKSQETKRIEIVGEHACFLLDNYVESIALMDKGDDLSKHFETELGDVGAMSTSSYATGSQNPPDYLYVSSSDESSDSE